MDDEARRRHDEATKNGEPGYIDPATGFMVFTRKALLARGVCCGCGCRHCPYHHQSVEFEARAGTIVQPAWMTSWPLAEREAVNLLFWSGGKDSYLAWLWLRENSPVQTCLITTFDGVSRRVAHQEVEIARVVDQANALRAPLLGVPLYPGSDYMERVTMGLAIVPNIGRLVFGDLHLEHIRSWREAAFSGLLGSRRCELLFPLWHADYARLLEALETAPVDIRISAVTHPSLSGRTGEVYDRHFVAGLTDDVDPFGENGEFHTLVGFDGSAGRRGNG